MTINPVDDKSTVSRLRTELLESTDETGLPHAELLSRLPQWLSLMLRATQAGVESASLLWTGRSRRRFERLLKQVLNWRRDDGRIVWPVAADDPAERTLPKSSRHRKSAALEQSVLAVAREFNLIPRDVAKPRRRRKAATNATVSPPIRPALQSDAAEWTWLRSDRSRRSDSIVVTHHEAWPHIEFSALGYDLLRGAWPIDVRFDSQPVAVSGRWECVCWNSDSQADYLELQLELGRITIERQVLLSRSEHFAFVADVVRFPEPGLIDFTTTLPLAPNVRATPDRFTRELRLLSSGLRVRVFPLALPQSRVIGTAGKLEVESCGRDVGEDIVRFSRNSSKPDAQAKPDRTPPSLARQASIALRLHQIAYGRAIYAPLLFDWSPKRNRVAADWRTLTVTEELECVRLDIAAGHRLRLGDRQWLVYHSLSKSPEPRAVLGHQTRNETVIGWFTPSGDVRPIMTVE